MLFEGYIKVYFSACESDIYGLVEIQGIVYLSLHTEHTPYNCMR